MLLVLTPDDTGFGVYTPFKLWRPVVELDQPNEPNNGYPYLRLSMVGDGRA